MSAQERLNSLADQVRRHPPGPLSERDTERILVDPFIEALGYDPRNPDEVRTQQEIRIGSTITRCDYAILHGQDIRVLMECKKSSVRLEDPGQLASYFSQVTTALLGIYTNGIEYRFYAEKREGVVKRMDDEPFVTLDLRNPDSNSMAIAGRCDRDAIDDADRFREWVNELRYERIIEDRMRHELAVKPSDELVFLVMSWVGSTEQTSEQMDRIRDIVKDIGCRIVHHRPLNGPSEELRRKTEIPLDPAPLSTEWIPLDGDFPTTGSPSPKEVKLPDGGTRRIVSWTDLPKEIAIWLHRRSLLTRDNCQFDVGRTRYLLSPDGKHRNGKLFHSNVDVGDTGIQMEGSFNPEVLVHHTVQLLKRCGQDPSLVFLRLR